jgi:hypothetical protein
MNGSIDTIAGALLWSRLGAAELIVGVIVGLMLLAFALPAKLHGGADEAEDRHGEGRIAGSQRR